LARIRAERRIRRKAKRLWEEPADEVPRIVRRAERTAERVIQRGSGLYEGFLSRREEGRRIVMRKVERLIFGRDAEATRRLRRLLYGERRRERR